LLRFNPKSSRYRKSSDKAPNGGSFDGITLSRDLTDHDAAAFARKIARRSEDVWINS
jgi:hypothetical protein